MERPKKRRASAGRPSAEQIYLEKLAEYDDKIMLKMLELAADGDPSMIRLWHQYRLGTPNKVKEEEKESTDESVDLRDLLRPDFGYDDSDDEDLFPDED